MLRWENVIYHYLLEHKEDPGQPVNYWEMMRKMDYIRKRMVTMRYLDT